MIDELIAATDLINTGLWGAMLLVLRIGGMLAVAPAFGEVVVPMRVKLGLTIAFTIVVWPAVAPGLTARPDDPLAFVAAMGGEVVTGVFFGLILRLFVITLQVAGTMAAVSTSISQIFGGTAGADPLPAMGHVLVVAGLALAALLGLHVHLAEFLIQSYRLVPPGEIPAPGVVLEAGLPEIARSFAFAFSIAAPFLVASLLYNIMLGVINRAMPQLMVAFVGAPAITAGGLILLLLTAPVGIALWGDAFMAFLADPFGGPR